MSSTTADFLMFSAMLLSIVAIVKILSDHLTTRKLVGAHLSDPALRDLLTWTQDAARQGALKWGLVWAAIGVGLVAVDLLPLGVESVAGIGIVILAGGAGLLGYYALARSAKGGRDA